MRDNYGRELKAGDVCLCNSNGSLHPCIIMENGLYYDGGQMLVCPCYETSFYLLKGDEKEEEFREYLLSKYNKLLKDREAKKAEKEKHSKNPIIGEWYRINHENDHVIYWGKGKLTKIENGVEEIQIGHFYRRYRGYKHEEYGFYNDFREIIPLSKNPRKAVLGSTYCGSKSKFEKISVPDHDEWENKGVKYIFDRI